MADMVTMFDERGRQVQMPKAEWVKTILPAALEKSWNEADRLYQLIVMTLEDELAEHMVAAAARLVEIDANAERAAIIRGIVQAKTGDVGGARATLRAFVDEHGETAVVLVNLAQLESREGRDGEAEKLVERALAMDPNEHAALGWWAALRRERGGEAAYEGALAEVAGRPGAWLALLWLGQVRLEAGDLEGALGRFRGAIERSNASALALMGVSGALGKAGRLREAVALVAPSYDVQKHGHEVGLNLVRAHQGMGELDEARAIVSRLQALRHPAFADNLARLEQEIAQSAPVRGEPAGSPPKLGAIALQRPLWTIGLTERSALVPAKPSSAVHIGFVSLADETVADVTPGARAEDMAGRLTRALPLYLAEALMFTTDAVTICSIPYVPGSGPVLLGKAWEIDAVGSLFSEPLPALVVFGAIRKLRGDRIVELQVWDVRERSLRHSVEVPLTADFSGVAAAAEAALRSGLERLGVTRREEAHAPFVAPSGQEVDLYVLALGQLLIQVMIGHGAFGREGLFNERGMFETYLNLAEKMPGAAAPRLMAACAVIAGATYGSPLAAQYRPAVERLLDPPLERLAPSLRAQLAAVT